MNDNDNIKEFKIENTEVKTATVNNESEEVVTTEANNEREEVVATEANNEREEAVATEANNESKDVVTTKANTESEEVVTTEANNESEEVVTTEANNESKDVVATKANTEGKEVVATKVNTDNIEVVAEKALSSELSDEGVVNKKKNSIFLTNIILVVCILVFAFSGGYLLKYYVESQITQGELDELIELRDGGNVDNEPDVFVNSRPVIKKYKKLFKKNSDMIGWIQVSHTKIDYPVMQKKDYDLNQANKEEFYLHKNFKKKYDINGLPFMDAKCDIDDQWSNLMVYGHHMKSGMMFAHLMDYQDKSFYEKHKTFNFDSLYEVREYEVVAAFYSKVYNSDQNVFKYYNWPGHLTAEQYNNYVQNIKKLSQYDTGVTPTYGEQLVTLVTCAYQTEEGRFVVVGRRKR